jgi:pantoate--beta-alanine ligase
MGYRLSLLNTNAKIWTLSPKSQNSTFSIRTIVLLILAESKLCPETKALPPEPKPMFVARTVEELRVALADFLLSKGDYGGLVPTMGALHQGHAALMKAARQSNDWVAATIFVNPLQFNRHDDLVTYPRREAEDLILLREYGVDLVFAPSPDQVYPPNWSAPQFDLGGLDLLLEGAFRPGHFKGVATVVSRFLDLIPCANLYFGLKDYQQCLVVERLLAQRKERSGKDVPMMVRVPTVRDGDGLALSSRNLLLGPDQLERAKGIARTWTWMKANLQGLEPVALIEGALERMTAEGFRNEYLALVRDGGLESWNKGNGIPRALYAGWLDEVRLIDNELIAIP